MELVFIFILSCVFVLPSFILLPLSFFFISLLLRKTVLLGSLSDSIDSALCDNSSANIAGDFNIHHSEWFGSAKTVTAGWKLLIFLFLKIYPGLLTFLCVLSILMLIFLLCLTCT